MDTGDWEGTYIDVGEDGVCCKFLLSNPHLIRWGKVGVGWGVGNHDSDKSPPCPTYAHMRGGGGGGGVVGHNIIGALEQSSGLGTKIYLAVSSPPSPSWS